MIRLGHRRFSFELNNLLLALREGVVDSSLHLWVECGKIVQLIWRDAFQIHVEEGVDAIAGDCKSTILLLWADDTALPKQRHDDGASRQHLVAKAEMVRADDRYLPAFSLGKLVIDGLDIVSDIDRLWTCLFVVIAPDEEEWLVETILDNVSKRHTVDIDSSFASRVVVAELRGCGTP